MKINSHHWLALMYLVLSIFWLDIAHETGNIFAMILLVVDGFAGALHLSMATMEGMR